MFQNKTKTKNKKKNWISKYKTTNAIKKTKI